jgi:hypothetical protein
MGRIIEALGGFKKTAGELLNVMKRDDAKVTPVDLLWGAAAIGVVGVVGFVGVKAVEFGLHHPEVALVTGLFVYTIVALTAT